MREKEKKSLKKKRRTGTADPLSCGAHASDAVSNPSPLQKKKKKKRDITEYLIPILIRIMTPLISVSEKMDE